MNTADLLDAAADVLEANGWCRNTLVSEPIEAGGIESYCAYGALNMADHGRWSYSNTFFRHPEQDSVHEAGQALADRLGLFGPQQVAEWNNRVAKDEYEVIDLFRSTAKDLRNEA